MNIHGMVLQCVRKGKRRWTYRIIVPPESWATYEMAAERLDEVLRAMKSWPNHKEADRERTD